MAAIWALAAANLNLSVADYDPTSIPIRSRTNGSASAPDGGNQRLGGASLTQGNGAKLCLHLSMRTNPVQFDMKTEAALAMGVRFAFCDIGVSCILASDVPQDRNRFVFEIILHSTRGCFGMLFEGVRKIMSAAIPLERRSYASAKAA